MTPRHILWDSVAQIHISRGHACLQSKAADGDLEKLADLTMADDALRAADRILLEAILVLGQAERAKNAAKRGDI